MTAGDAARWGDLMVEGGARRQEIRRRHGNGLDTVEVDHGGRRLVLTFLEHAPTDVHPANVRIDGPPGAVQVRVTGVRRAAEDDPHLEDRLFVELAGPGGVGRYTLRLVEPAASGRPGWRPLRGMDPRFAAAGFTFDIDEPVPVPGSGPAGAAAGAGPQASYLARDYEGLRQLILDRLAATMPAWTERHIADIGITLVELFAYVGDDLSYYQDAVATEAYLQTARRRISVRRHARLVDYRLGEGCQARAWVCLSVAGDVELPLREVEFAAAPGLLHGAPPVLSPSAIAPGTGLAPRRYTPVRATIGGPAVVTAGSHGSGPMFAVKQAHNGIALWAWGERDSWLRTGATTAVLADGWAEPDDHGPSAPRLLDLRAGDVVVFEATADPSGIGPPDPGKRHPVRLTAAHTSVDRLYGQPILEITWAPPDALPFDLQVTARGDDRTTVACAVVRGNVVLAGDGAVVSEQLAVGQTVLSNPSLTWACPYPDPAAVARHQAKMLRRLPQEWRQEVEAWRQDALEGQPLDEQRLARLRALLGEDMLTEFGLGGRDKDRPAREAEGLRSLLRDADRLLASRVRRLQVLAALARASGPLEPVLLREVADDWGSDLAGSLSTHDPAAWGPACAATNQDASSALPLLALASVAGAGAPESPWTVVPDLIESPPDSRQVMAEVDDAGLGHLRFSPGDQPTEPVEASYQVGQGAAGNLPAGAINAIVPLTPGAEAAAAVVRSVDNPLPAVGGLDPQTVAAAKAAVPGAFLAGQPRAVVATDFTALAEQVGGVRRATTTLRWTGIRYAADVAIQPAAGEDPDAELLAAVDDALWPVRRIGYDLWVRPPAYRSLVIGLDVDIAASASNAGVTAALAALLGSGWQADGTAALFNPQRLAFGQPVYASPIVAAVQDVPGVRAVVLTRLGFLGPPGAPIPARPPQRLRLRPSEIARLDNDPAAPEHGYAVLNVRGGR
jgi:predicted phage baseplate assembly protein